MIAHVTRSRCAQTSWQSVFLAMLPTIQRQAGVAFRHLRGNDHEEAVHAAVANAWLAFVRLAARGRLDRAFPTTLARFAVAHVRMERKIGCARNVNEVLSQYAQRKNQFVVQHLDQSDAEDGGWLEAVVEDPRTPVFDQVWFRIDFPEWLSRLSDRDRRIAQSLAHGHSTSEVARKYRISSGRVSQLRRKLHHSWRQFQGETRPPSTACGEVS